MHTLTVTTPLVRLAPEPDDDALRTIIAKRIARDRGLSLPVAALTASLAGLGPRESKH